MKKLGITLCLALMAPLLFASGAEEAPSLTHQMMELAIQIGVILFAARLGNLLFTKLRLPSVLGELCAGMVIGPFALGRYFDWWFFHEIAGSSVGVSPELYGMCTIASIVLLFLVGAETDLRMFMRYSAVGSLVGIGGVSVSFVTGAWVGMTFLDLPWDHPACIFLGVMSTATSVSITARILSERKKLDSQEGVTILAGAVIDDVLGIIMLAIGMGMIAAQQSSGSVAWGDIGMIAMRSLGIWLGATILGVAISKGVARALKPCGTHGEVAILTLGLALIVGGLFEKAHLAMIIGAYVTGLSFSRTEISLMIQEKLHGVYQFFVPIFFAVMGMMVDVSLMLKPQVLILGAVYTGIAVAAKIIGCGLPTLLFGFNPIGALRIGFGMVPRGEVALIIAGIASSSGLLPENIASEIFGVAVMMTLITTLVAPPLLIGSFQLPWSGLCLRKRQKESSASEATPTLSYHFPNHDVTNMVMSKIRQNLQKEGFFIHQVDPAQGLFQARRTDYILNITCGDCDIEVSATKSAMPFVRVVLSESKVDFEAVTEALRNPVGNEGEYVRLDDADVTDAKKPILKRYILERNIIHRLHATTRDEVIQELLTRLHEGGFLENVEVASTEVLHRERLMSTGVGYGVACPHARTAAVANLVCAIGITREPIDFSEEPDGKGCRIVVVTLTPEGLNSPYMTFLTALMSVLSSDLCRTALLNASNAVEMRKILVGN